MSRATRSASPRSRASAPRAELGAGAVKTGVGIVAVVERTGETLAPVVVWLIELDQRTHLCPPVFGSSFAHRLQEIEAAEDLGEALHLGLVWRIDSARGRREGNEQQQSKQGAAHGLT